MKKLKWIIVSFIAVLAIIAIAEMYKFNYKANQPDHNVDGNKVKIVKSERLVDKTNFSGNYVTEDYQKRS